jgi:hypothetical protein
MAFSPLAKRFPDSDFTALPQRERKPQDRVSCHMRRGSGTSGGGDRNRLRLPMKRNGRPAKWNGHHFGRH